MSETTKFQERMSRVEELIEKIEQYPDDAIREPALELIQTLMDFHSAGIERMMDLTADAGAAGYAIFDEMARDEIVSSLLLLYGLHPRGIDERVAEAIEKVRPTLGLHDGDVEVLGIDEGAVMLRLKGSCDGCPSSVLTLKHTIEEAVLAAAPDVTSIKVEGIAEIASKGDLVQIKRDAADGRPVYDHCEFDAAA